MLNVAFEEKDGKLTLTLKGHAGQAIFGKDIVCSAASILAYTVAQFVHTAEGKGELVLRPVIKLEEGDATVSCEPYAVSYATIKGMYLFAEVGFKLLANNYPLFVKLKEFGTDSNP
jgi:uncharacterized protein YsxB (DUF464 family)